MKLSSDTLAFIQTVVETAHLVDIDNVIIDSESLRGLSEGSTVVLLEKNVPNLEFEAIGLNRTDVFQQRLNVVRELDNFTVDAVVDDEKGFVRSLTMKAKGTKVDYRCANPTTIRAPRILHDEMLARVVVNADAVRMLQKGASAMGSDAVSFTSDADGVSFALVDLNQDTFEHAFAEHAEPLKEGTPANFSHKYPVKTVLALLKHSSSDLTFFEVGVKGTLRVKVNGLGVYVIPMV